MNRTSATLAGLVAIALWATTMGGARLLTEPLGAMTAAAGVYTTGGVLGCLWFYRTREGRRRFLQLPRRYLIGCGGLFVIYTISLYTAVDLASSRQQVLEVGIINYLWPGLTLILSVPLLHRRSHPLFPLGIAMAFVGAVLATTPETGWNLAAFAENLRTNSLPYALALEAAFVWALYSILVRRWSGAAAGAGIPVFILATGLIMLTARVWFGEMSQWSGKTIALMIYMALCPVLLGYVLWDIAMRRGNITLLASCAYSIPVISTLVSCLVLSVVPTATLVGGCVLVVVGAVVCKRCLK